MLWRWVWLLLLALCLDGCATARLPPPAAARPFDFHQDTFAYPNELLWEYRLDPATGKGSTFPRKPKPTYALHCFVMARLARQIFEQARFDPAQPVATESAYRQLVRRLMRASPRRPRAEAEKFVIPGYTSLRAFSRDQEKVLKSECGGAWRSYWQMGHWRMIFPFSRAHQERTARRLAGSLQAGRLAVVHILRFPQLTINHAIVLYAAQERGPDVVFDAYDPNNPDAPTTLRLDRATRTFHLPPNRYFAGGRVDVYEVYRGLCY